MCAWQQAGPHRSEYSATSSTRDRRTGRARLFGILPALALLLTALLLFAAAPADALLRSNLQATAGDGEVTVTWDEIAVSWRFLVQYGEHPSRTLALSGAGVRAKSHTIDRSRGCEKNGNWRRVE